MKKVFLTLSLIVIASTLVACNSTNKKVEMSFQDAYDVLMENDQSTAEKEAIASMLKGSRAGESSISLETKGSETGVNLQIDSEAVSDQDTLTSSGTSHIDAKLTMNDQEYKVKTDIKVFQTMSGNTPNQYFSIDNLDIFLGSGNAQGDFINAMVKPIVGTWISMDIMDQLPQTPGSMTDTINPANEGKKLISNILNISTVLENNMLLENLGETTYEGNLAYNVKVKTEAVKNIFASIISGTNFTSTADLSEIDQMDIQGLLIVKDTDEVDLLINKINDDTQTTILENKEEIVVTNIDEVGGKIVITLTKKSKSKYTVDIDVKVIEDNASQEATTIKGEIDIQVKIAEDKMHSMVDGIVKIESKQLMEVLGDDTLEFTFAMDSANNKVYDVVLHAPTSSVLFSQLLSDNFGLPYMQKNPEDMSMYTEDEMEIETEE